MHEYRRFSLVYAFLLGCILSKIKQFPSPKGSGNDLILDKMRVKLFSTFNLHHLITHTHLSDRREATNFWFWHCVNSWISHVRQMTGQHTFDVHVLVRPFLFSSRAALQQILAARTSRQEGLVDNNKFTRIATIVIKIEALQKFSMYVQSQGFASSDSLKPIAIRSTKWHRGASILAVLWSPFLGNMSW